MTKPLHTLYSSIYYILPNLFIKTIEILTFHVLVPVRKCNRLSGQLHSNSNSILLLLLSDPLLFLLLSKPPLILLFPNPFPSSSLYRYQADREELVSKEGVRCLPFLPWPMRASTEDAGNLVPLDPQLPIFTPPKYGQMHKPKTMEDPVYGLQVSAIIRETKEFGNNKAGYTAQDAPSMRAFHLRK